MTREEFLAELAKTPRAWRMTQSGALRCARGACPINAVMYAHDNNHPDLTAAGFAADLLGLNCADFYQIVMAADNCQDPPTQLRADLLKACGLA